MWERNVERKSQWEKKLRKSTQDWTEQEGTQRKKSRKHRKRNERYHIAQRQHATQMQEWQQYATSQNAQQRHAQRHYAKWQRAQKMHAMFDVNNMINTHSNIRYDDKDDEKLVEGLNEPAETPKKYGLPHILSHIGNGDIVKHVVWWCGSTSLYDTVLLPNHISKHFITR